MINANRKHDHRGNAMNNPSQVFVPTEHQSKPRIGVLKREAAQHQRNEARQQQPVLHALIETQTHNGPCLAFSRCNLTRPNQSVMNDHTANHKRD